MGWKFKRSYTGAYYKTIDIIVITFGLDVKEEFNDLDFWIKEFKLNWGDNNPKMILLGTKWDLKEDREVTKEEAQEFAGNNGMDYFEVSALTGENLDAFLSYLFKHCFKHSNEDLIEFINNAIGKQIKNLKDKKSLLGKFAKLFK